MKKFVTIEGDISMRVIQLFYMIDCSWLLVTFISACYSFFYYSQFVIWTVITKIVIFYMMLEILLVRYISFLLRIHKKITKIFTSHSCNIWENNQLIHPTQIQKDIWVWKKLENNSVAWDFSLLSFLVGTVEAIRE